MQDFVHQQEFTLTFMTHRRCSLNPISPHTSNFHGSSARQYCHLSPQRAGVADSTAVPEKVCGEGLLGVEAMAYGFGVCHGFLYVFLMYVCIYIYIHIHI